METSVNSCHGLHPATSPRPLAPDRFLTKVVKGSSWASVEVASLDLRLECHFYCPVRLRKGFSRESISVKLIFNSTEGASGLHILGTCGA
jgi:hypothetical protein